MAKIAVLVSNPCIADARVIKMARAASEVGHEVHIFATLKEGIESYEYDEENKIYYHRFIWNPGQTLTKNGFLNYLRTVNRKIAGFIIKKMTAFLKYKLYTDIFSPQVLFIQPDIVHAHDLITLPAGYEVTKKCNAKLVYDAHELELHRNPPLPFFQKLWVGHIEKKFAKHADGINTVGKMVGEELSKHLKRDDINIIYNSPIIERSHRSIRKDIGITPNIYLIIYVGKVTMGRGIEEIIEHLKVLKNVVFATIGPCDSKVKEEIDSLAQKRSVSNRVYLLPPVPFEEVVDYIKSADLGIIPVEAVTLSYQYCMPNKLFELSFANVPILSNKLDEIELFIEEYGNGMITDTKKWESMPHMINYMLENKSKFKLTDERYQHLCKVYSWETQKNKLLSLYDKLLY